MHALMQDMLLEVREMDTKSWYDFVCVGFVWLCVVLYIAVLIILSLLNSVQSFMHSPPPRLTIPNHSQPRNLATSTIEEFKKLDYNTSVRIVL